MFFYSEEIILEENVNIYFVSPAPVIFIKKSRTFDKITVEWYRVRYLSYVSGASLFLISLLLPRKASNVKLVYRQGGFDPPTE